MTKNEPVKAQGTGKPISAPNYRPIDTITPTEIEHIIWTNPKISPDLSGRANSKIVKAAQLKKVKIMILSLNLLYFPAMWLTIKGTGPTNAIEISPDTPMILDEIP